ncbi:MAG: hypothetical protein ACXAB2_15200 [Candidatus Hodarchaeales archaeon]|jgi:hypothetical protein
MKRTPLAIVTDLVVTLNTLLIDDEYSINALAGYSQLHWESISRYLEILQIVQDFCPKFILTSKNKVKLLSRTPNVRLANDEQVLVYCLQNQADNKLSAISLPTSMESEVDFLVNKKFARLTVNGKLYLTKKGKSMAVDIFFEIQQTVESSMGGSSPEVNETEIVKVLSAFRQSSSFESFAHDLYTIIAEKFEKAKEKNEIELH